MPAQVAPLLSERLKKFAGPRLPTGATWYQRVSSVGPIWAKPPSPPSIPVHVRLPVVDSVPLSWLPPTTVPASLGCKPIPVNRIVFRFPFRLGQLGPVGSYRHRPPSFPSNNLPLESNAIA